MTTQVADSVPPTVWFIYFQGEENTLPTECFRSKADAELVAVDANVAALSDAELIYPKKDSDLYKNHASRFNFTYPDDFNDCSREEFVEYEIPVELRNLSDIETLDELRTAVANLDWQKILLPSGWGWYKAVEVKVL